MFRNFLKRQKRLLNGSKNIISNKKIALKYAEELKKRGVSPKVIILYGSYAKGKATSYSDIDLVIISPDLRRFKPIQRLEFLSRATLNIDKPLEVLGYTPKEIPKKKGKSIFWDEITKSGKTVYASQKIA